MRVSRFCHVGECSCSFPGTVYRYAAVTVFRFRQNAMVQKMRAPPEMVSRSASQQC